MYGKEKRQIRKFKKLESAGVLLLKKNEVKPQIKNESNSNNPAS